MNLYLFLGILGLIFIIIGVLKQERKSQNIFYVLGGLSLLIYSIYIGSIIFIILQCIFILAASFDLIRCFKTRNSKE